MKKGKGKKIFGLLLLVCVCVFVARGCGNSRNSQKEYDELIWPDSELVSLLPMPESNVGRISLETVSRFSVYVGETSKQQYNDYVSACIDSGFNVDYSRSDNYYSADNIEGYSLSIHYQSEDTMYISINAPDETDDIEVLSGTEYSDNTENMTEDESVDGDTDADITEIMPESEVSTSSDNIRPEFKEAMDSYEAFFDEYIAFMQKYTTSDDTMGMLADYATYMTQYVEMMGKMEAVEDDDLSAAEAAYYLEVTTRISQKLLQAEM